jgi:hypothetical protein
MELRRVCRNPKKTYHAAQAELLDAVACRR